MSDNLTYAGVGVDYDAMDPFKRMAQRVGRQTAGNITRLNGGEFREFEASRGESAYLIEAGKSYFAHVEEGLGTKNLVADAMQQLTGTPYYRGIAQDTVAMIVNDMITVGALPLSVAMHLAVGSSDWFKDEVRSQELVEGWCAACDLAGCTWGCGETPTLQGVVYPGAVVLSGSAMGIVKPKSRLITPNVQHDDIIFFLESSGIHANGLTLARRIAEKLPNGYLTQVPGGRTYGDELLHPTYIYVEFIEECLKQEVDIHYAVNITGHGWRKLMRGPQPFTYVIDQLPKEQPIFRFIQEHGPVSDEEAYANLNMGAGFAIFVPESEVHKVYSAWKATCPLYPSHYFSLLQAGYIERSAEKKVVVPSKNLEYLASTLRVR